MPSPDSSSKIVEESSPIGGVTESSSYVKKKKIVSVETAKLSPDAMTNKRTSSRLSGIKVTSTTVSSLAQSTVDSTDTTDASDLKSNSKIINHTISICN